MAARSGQGTADLGADRAYESLAGGELYQDAVAVDLHGKGLDVVFLVLE